MLRISENIVEDEKIKSTNKLKTVRAIIIKDNKLLMVYSPLFNDYMFPGGHVKRKERKIKALKRELNEELGAERIIVKKPFGYIKEIRYDAKDNQKAYHQTSYYYFCDILEIGTQNLDYLESLYGVVPKLVTIDDAIKHNEKIAKDEIHLQQGFKTVMERELKVLYALKEKGILNEKV